MKTSKSQIIRFSTHKGYVFVNPQQVIYCKSDGNYSTLHRVEEEPLFLCRQLGELERLFPSAFFFRVHHSYLVNLNYAKGFLRQDGGQLRLINDQFLPVARRRRKALVERFRKG